MPGLSLHNGLMQLVGPTPDGGDPAEGASTLMLAFGIALAIAAGATLGTYLVRPFDDQLRRIPLHAPHRSRKRGKRR